MEEMQSSKPERLRQSFANPVDAASHLIGLAETGRLAGPASIQAAPASTTVEDTFPTRPFRGMLVGALVGIVVGISLGVATTRGVWFAGSWGGLLSGGVAAEAVFLAVVLGSIGALIGGFVGFSRNDPEAASAGRAELVAMVRPEVGGTHS